MRALEAGGIKETIAVLGASSRATDEQVIAGFRVGREIGLQGFHLATGMTLGVPYAAAIGAKSTGAMVIGVSPAANRREHVERYGRPIDFIDAAIYTGMGLEGRQPILVRTAGAALFVGGELGTLAEFSAAWTSGVSVLGVLEGMGGISDVLRNMLIRVESNYGSVVLYDKHPETLVQRVSLALAEQSGLHEWIEDSKVLGASVKTVIEGYLSGDQDSVRLEVEP